MEFMIETLANTPWLFFLPTKIPKVVEGSIKIIHPVINSGAAEKTFGAEETGRVQYLNDALQFTRDVKSLHSQIKKMDTLRKVIKDFGMGKFYLQARGHTPKIVLKGYMGLRDYINYPTSSVAHFDKTFNISRSAFTKAAGKSIALEAAFELTELMIDLHASQVDGVPLSRAKVKSHMIDLGAVAAGGGATIFAAATITTIASGFAVPVIVAVGVPLLAGALTKKGFKSTIEWLEQSDYPKFPDQVSERFSTQFNYPLLSPGPPIRCNQEQVFQQFEAWINLGASTGQLQLMSTVNSKGFHIP